MDCPPETVIPDSPRRPRDFAVLLLAIGTGPPRARARDQQADVAGGELLKRILDRVAAIDPEPEDLEATLARIVFEIGDPTGPTRAVCSQLLEEWSQTQHAPGAWPWLISEALERTGRGDEPRKRRRRFDADS
jgi:hypothetical protein